MSATLSRTAIVPRIIRAGDAPAYLGMSRGVFDQQARPYLREFPIGTQGVGFDRLELDAWMDAYIEKKAIAKTKPSDKDAPCSERHGKGEKLWQEKPSPVSKKCRTASGRSTNDTRGNDFRKALELVTGKKRSST